jgi:hypothetical protein
VAAAAERCPQLRYLDLGYTRVKDQGVAKVVAGRPQLQYLALDSTHVTDVVVQTIAEHCPRLQHLDLRNTWVRTVDRATLESRDAEEIFTAFFRGVALPVVRIVFVGTGNIGKSFLFERCFLDEVQKPNFREETAAFELIRPERCQWVPTLGPRRLEPRVWDFGGQLVKHGVHETFLGDDGRTVYILVTSSNAIPGSQLKHDEETGNAIAYWLRTIHHFGGSEAPVIVAVTQCDRISAGGRGSRRAEGDGSAGASPSRPIDAPFPPIAKSLGQLTPPDIQSQFDVTIKQVVDHLSACQPDKNSIQPLRDAINAAVALRPGITEQKVSPELLKLRQHVEAELPKFALVSVNTYRQWCVECGVTDTGQQDVLRGILHHMGCLFYFGADREGQGAAGRNQRETRRTHRSGVADGTVQHIYRSRTAVRNEGEGS